MSISASYRRITQEQLREAIVDRDVAERLAWAIVPDQDDVAPAVARGLYLGIDWDAIGYLLAAAGGPAEIIYGIPILAELASGVRPIPVDEVRKAAQWLSAISFDELFESADPNDPRRHKVYKLNLDLADHVAWARESYQQLVQFVAAAARDEEAILILFA